MFNFLSRLFGGGGPSWSAEERELFHQVALADPDDPRPRLRLADALEKRGEPMGEYIRLTHEAEALPEGDPARAPLDARLEELLQKHGKSWCRPMKRLGLQPEIMGHYYPPMWMTHGVLDQIEVDRPGILPERAAALFEAMPALRVLTFSAGVGEASYEPDYAAIMRLPQMEQIGELQLSSTVITRDDLSAIASSPHMTNLRVLRAQGTFGPEGARRIAASRSLTRLRELELSSAEIGDEGARALAGSTNLAGLRCLELPGIPLNVASNPLTAAGAAALARSPHLAALRTLKLSYYRFGPEGGRALAASPHLRPAELELKGTELGPEGGQALAGAPWLAGLTHLNLSQNELGDDGARGLAASSATALEVLDLGHNAIGDEGMKALAGSPVLANLSELELAINNIGPAGAAALAGVTLPRLKKLRLSYNPLGDAGARALASSPLLESLTELELNECQLGPEGVSALAGSPRLRGLRLLSLNGNTVGEKGARALAGSPHLANLTRLSLWDAKLDDDAGSLLYERFGDALSR